MTASPTVSICIRAWRRKSLTAAIESVLAQTFTDLEVVVADDRGDLEDVSSAFADPRVRYHRNEERLGVTGNARAALNLARGTYIGLLADDDRLLPGYVEEAVNRFRDDPALGIVFTNHYFDRTGQLLARSIPLAAGRYEGPDFLPTLLRHQPVWLSAALMRREVWEEGERSHPLQELAVADMQIWIRAVLANWPFYYIDSPLAIMQIHDGRISLSDAFRDYQVALWELFEFEDPESERLRREHLARSYVSRAAAHVRSGKGLEARADLDHAREADADEQRVRRRLFALLARNRVLASAARRAWHLFRRVRPYRSGELGRVGSP